jgi:hypothetical protein
MRAVPGPAAAVGTIGGLALAGLATCVVLLVLQQTRNARHCDGDASCGKGKRCWLARCVECVGSGDCAATTGRCDPVTNRCSPCASTGECPGGYGCVLGADGAPGTCVPGLCGHEACRTDQICVDDLFCECGPGLQTGPRSTCLPPVGANPAACQTVIPVAPGQPAVPGHPAVGDLFSCTAVPGVDAENSGLATGKPWSLDQIYLDYYDDPAKLKQSWPGNQGATYDHAAVSVVSPVGCVAPTTDGGAETDNCSRGLRPTSLLVAAKGAKGDGAPYAESKDVAAVADVGSVFFAQNAVYGTDVNWETGGVVAGNVYMHGSGVRMRMVGDLVGAKAGDLTSDDGQALVMGWSAGAPPDLPAACNTAPAAGAPTACGAATTPAPPPTTRGGVAPTPATTCAAPITAACLTSSVCRPLTAAGTTARVPALAPVAGGTMTVADRTQYGRTGGCLVTQDVWGPGEYEFEISVPDGPVGVAPGSVLDTFCLPGYAMSLTLESEQDVHVLFDPAAGDAWVPSEQAPWTGKPTNTCDQLTPAKPTPTPTPAVAPFYLSSVLPDDPFNWGGKDEAQACVPTATDEEALLASNTYKLMGCLPCTTSESDKYCKNIHPGLTCQSVLNKSASGSQLACAPADKTDPLYGQITKFIGSHSGIDGDGDLGDACLAYQRAWETGIDGARWCGHKNSYLGTPPDGLCLPPDTPALAKYGRSAQNIEVLFTEGKQVAGRCVGQAAPELPGFSRSNQLGRTEDAAGGANIMATVRHTIRVDMPPDAPPYPTVANRANGAWGFDAVGVTTGLADNGATEGTTPWLTKAVAAYQAPEWPAGGASCPAATFANAPDRPTVRYRVDWWADEDPTKSYVDVTVNGRKVYSTSRFVPSRGGRWKIGPWPGRFATGYKDAGRTTPNAPDFDWVYVDLVSASFRPYGPDHVPAGRDAATLKLRALGSATDQAFKGTGGSTDPSIDPSCVGGACEVRCGLVPLAGGAARALADAPACRASAAGAAAAAAPRCKFNYAGKPPDGQTCPGTWVEGSCPDPAAAKCDHVTGTCQPCEDSGACCGSAFPTCVDGVCRNTTSSGVGLRTGPLPLPGLAAGIGVTAAVVVICVALAIWLGVSSRRQAARG